jgi:hypothetical protein
VIVRPHGDGLLLLRQPDHARLAATVMERCVALAGHPRRGSILLAVAEHDSGWGEEDAAPSVDANGELADYVRLPLARRQGVWYRGIDRLATQDAWAAALVAHHGWFVYDRFRDDAEWTAFFAQMASRRDALARASGRPLADVEVDYPFLRLGDLISLAFCAGDRPKGRYEQWTIRCDGTRMTVEPDPFGGVEVPLAIAGKWIARRRYASDAELQTVVAAAPTVVLEGAIAGRAS